VDENTAIVVQGDSLAVIGEGAVYIVDAEGVSYSNIAEERRDRPLSMFDVGLQVLSSGDTFDLATRKPSFGPFG
jgi:cyanophycinase